MEEKNVPSVGQWMLYILVAGIPLVGFVMLIVWMLDKTNVARKTGLRQCLSGW